MRRPLPASRAPSVIRPARVAVPARLAPGGSRRPSSIYMKMKKLRCPRLTSASRENRGPSGDLSGASRGHPAHVLDSEVHIVFYLCVLPLGWHDHATRRLLNWSRELNDWHPASFLFESSLMTTCTRHRGLPVTRCCGHCL